MISEERTEENGWFDLDAAVNEARANSRVFGVYLADSVNKFFPDIQCLFVLSRGTLPGKINIEEDRANVVGYEVDGDKVRILGPHGRTTYNSYRNIGIRSLGDDEEVQTIRRGKDLTEELE